MRFLLVLQAASTFEAVFKSDLGRGPALRDPVFRKEGCRLFLAHRKIPQDVVWRC